MANIMKKTNKFINKSVNEPSVDITVDSDEAVDTVEEEIEEVVEPVVVKREVKKFEATDGIPCRSIVSGGLYMSGIKSRIMYEWADNGDVTEVEYQDIVAAIRSNVSYINKPYFIIEDEDILAQFPQLNKIYASMYSFKDLKEVLIDLPPKSMKATILSLPEGAKESIKNLASQMISNGTLDSVQKIKILDEIFDTELMLMTGLFN